MAANIGKKHILNREPLGKSYNKIGFVHD